jgi:beta-N-acetylhexosaminidase
MGPSPVAHSSEMRRLSDANTMIRRILSALLLLVWLAGGWLPVSAAADTARPLAGSPLAPQPPATAMPAPVPTPPVDVHPLLDSMSVADKVGQLFIVTFQGNDISENSDIATLVRDYRVGGVVMLPANGNFRTSPVQANTGTSGQKVALNTPQQIARLSDQLQALAMALPRPLPPPPVITGTSTTTATAGATSTITTTGQMTETTITQTAPIGVPLLIGLEWTGDDNSAFYGDDGFTPLPSAMAIGATWTPTLAEKVGEVVGQETQAAGVNLLLGPPLDVLDVPRPGGLGDLGIRSFGGDPFWVGQMGRAFIQGVSTGSGGGVFTAATHFPGQGASDRRPEDEVATVQKSVQQLRQIELAPFVTVAGGGKLSDPGTTSIMMTSHIRYRGFQGNIRQLTPPISLAPQLQDLMALKEFADWRSAGGVLMSDALGVPAVRRYYDPQLQKFPHRQVAQDAFLAGNDLLYLSRFALTDEWPDQFAAIKETILFFQSKYLDDSEFRARVDASVSRILQLKMRLYPGDWKAVAKPHDLSALQNTVGLSASVTTAVARAGVSLIYPGRDELADRMPSPPLRDENIVIFTDARQTRDCATCEPRPLIAPTALQDIMLRLYGPSATGQVLPNRIRSLTFADLNRFLQAAPGAEPDIENAIDNAKWIIFAELDYNPDEAASSAALHTFLAKRSDSLRDKRLVVMAFDAPYYLDTTEVSKLTAYFGIYGKSAPFLETAVRALFREFNPVGAPPVSVTGINYVLLNQLEPAPGQIISLAPVGPGNALNEKSAAIQVGSSIDLETGIIVDHNGHPVPDGTPVDFHLRYPTEALQLAPLTDTTVGGQARIKVTLDRAGELWITAQAGEAQDSTRIVLKVGGDKPGSIATVMPTPTAQPTPTATPAPTTTPTAIPSPTPAPTPEPEPPAPPTHPRVAWPAFVYGLIGVFLSSGTAFTVRRRMPHRDGTQQLGQALSAALWAVAVAWSGYLLYSLGWLPGATQLQAAGSHWAAGVVTLSGGALTLLWSGRSR